MHAKSPFLPLSGLSASIDHERAPSESECFMLWTETGVQLHTVRSYSSPRGKHNSISLSGLQRKLYKTTADVRILRGAWLHEAFVIGLVPSPQRRRDSRIRIDKKERAKSSDSACSYTMWTVVGRWLRSQRSGDEALWHIMCIWHPHAVHSSLAPLSLIGLKSSFTMLSRDPAVSADVCNSATRKRLVTRYGCYSTVAERRQGVPELASAPMPISQENRTHEIFQCTTVLHLHAEGRQTEAVASDFRYARNLHV